MCVINSSFDLIFNCGFSSFIYCVHKCIFICSHHILDFSNPDMHVIPEKPWPRNPSSYSITNLRRALSTLSTFAFDCNGRYHNYICNQHIQKVHRGVISREIHSSLFKERCRASCNHRRACGSILIRTLADLTNWQN